MPDMSSVFTISKVILILIFISFGTLVTDQAAVPVRRQDHLRTCLNYGHACWGAHGKRSGDKNLLMEKLISTALREPTDSKLLPIKDPEITQPVPNHYPYPLNSLIYGKKNKNARSYQNEIQDILNSNFKNNGEGNLIPAFSHDPLYILRIFNPSTKLNDMQNENDEQSDYFNEDRIDSAN